MGSRISLLCPAPSGSHQGNRVTALRWARILRSLGHRVRIEQNPTGSEIDLLIGLHARRSAPAVRLFRSRFPEAPLIVALTGTDLYRDLDRSRAALRSLELADRLVLLQPRGRTRLAPAMRRKARVIYQSVAVPTGRARKRPGPFTVCVLGHLRPVKDPLRTALAVRNLPSGSRIRVVHIGAALQPALAARARSEERRNPRYRWLGDRPRPAALRMLARSDLLVLSSRMEGGANVIGEAATFGVPVLASRVEGNLGLLGARHPGLFPVGDTAALRTLLLRAENDRSYYARLREGSSRIAPLFRPAQERRAWRSLLAELGLR
ncbi:MAG: selenoneine biosynthesis selenosugar synthase SenB [Myxococcota bacterium]